MEAFACVAAPLALKAVTSHRTPQSSPFWSRPLFTVRQPGNREDYGVRRDVAALAFPRSGETGPPPRSARRPLRMWAKVSRMRRGGAGVRSRGSPGPHLNGYEAAKLVGGCSHRRQHHGSAIRLRSRGPLDGLLQHPTGTFGLDQQGSPPRRTARTPRAHTGRPPDEAREPRPPKAGPRQEPPDTGATAISGSAPNVVIAK